MKLLKRSSVGKPMSANQVSTKKRRRRLCKRTEFWRTKWQVTEGWRTRYGNAHIGDPSAGETVSAKAVGDTTIQVRKLVLVKSIPENQGS